MAGNGGIIGPVNTITDAYKDLVTSITATGCFTKASTNPGAPGNATVIAAAGGGASGADGGGAGGAGGLLITACHPLPGSAVPVTIGAGGVGVSCTAQRGANGANTVFGAASPLTATGGGGGGSPTPPPNVAGAPGGSGGGGREAPSGPPTGNAGGSGTACQGNNGGSSGTPGNGAAGAGGGAGGVGQMGVAPSAPTCGVQGGAGLDIAPYLACAATPYTIPNSGIYSGGGGGRPGGDANSGGGGACGSGAGTVNTGGGAGAGAPTGGNGGSGLVVVVEKCQAASGVVASGMWQMNTVYQNVKDGNWSN